MKSRKTLLAIVIGICAFIVSVAGALIAFVLYLQKSFSEFDIDISFDDSSEEYDDLPTIDDNSVDSAQE